MKRKIVTVVGARPQFVKASILSSLIANEPEISEIIIHSGQHYSHNMSESFFTELGIPQPKYNINAGSGSHSQQTSAIMLGLEPLIETEKPDLLLVYGDTNTTLASALVAAKSNVELAHIEAGLRSFRKGMPEEINRVVADRLSDYLFCPTELSLANLIAEGKGQQSYLTGDVMLDVFLKMMRSINVDLILKDYNLTRNNYIFSTFHRAENVDNPDTLKAILANLEILTKTGEKVVLALHPRTRQNMENFNLSAGDIIITDPLPYKHTLAMLAGACCVITDSGGLQKEAYFSKTKCITVRDETEWIETIDTGWNILLPPKNVDNLNAMVAEQMNSPDGNHKPLYGEGNASLKILKLLMNFLNA